MRNTAQFSPAAPRLPALLAALLTAGTLACGPTPIEPNSVAPTPSATAVPTAGNWTVTLTVAQKVGSFCVVLPGTGTTLTALYTIQGEGTPTLTFVGPDIEWNSYTVAVRGLAFQSAPVTLYQAASCAPFTYSAQFSGTFSADRNGFTATELETYTLTTGEVVSRTWAWSGRRN